MPPNTGIIVALSSAHLDPDTFPKPHEVDLTQPLDSCLIYVLSFYQRTGKDTGIVVMTALFKVVIVKRVKESERESGLGKNVETEHGRIYMTADGASSKHWPTTMKVIWVRKGARTRKRCIGGI